MDREDHIAALKQERDAVIVAHYYVNEDIQRIADYVGDSFKLSKIASTLDNQTIVFAGVQFMGESAKILAPEKTVLLPDPYADCPMAHMVTQEFVDEVKATQDDLAVVCYVNSTAEIKAWSDVCVTSSNALQVVSALPQRNILFIPDQNLGHYLAEQLPDKNFIFNDGFCPIHQAITAKSVKELKACHPDARILAHPECNAEVRALADYLGSTSGIINEAITGNATDYIICTVQGVIYDIKAGCEGQGKHFYFPTLDNVPCEGFHHTCPLHTQGPCCPDMSGITFDQIITALDGTNPDCEVTLDPDLAAAARGSLVRMLELSH